MREPRRLLGEARKECFEDRQPGHLTTSGFALWSSISTARAALADSAPACTGLQPGSTASLELIAELHPPIRRTGIPYTGRYAVSIDGEKIVANSRDPECDLARELLARGIVGNVKVIDADTGKHRSTVNIEKAAKVTAEEGPSGPRFVKYRHQTVGDRSPIREEHLPPTGLAAPNRQQVAR
jgi:hypothetical protein